MILKEQIEYLNQYISENPGLPGKFGGNFGTIDKFFLLNKTELTIRKTGNDSKKTIVVLDSGREFISNTETIRYLLEFMIFLKIIDDKILIDKLTIAGIINWMLEGNQIKISKTISYERLSDYINAERKQIIDNICLKIEVSYGKGIYSRHIKAAKEYFTNKNVKFRSHKDVWSSLIEGSNKEFTGSAAFMKKMIKSKLEQNIPIKLIEKAKSLADLKTREEFDQTIIAMKLRREFKKQLQLKVINNYSKELNENFLLTDFPYLEGAHIIPVYYLLKEKRYSDISNPDNGLLIDPNLHKIIDNTNSRFQNGKIIFNNEIMGMVKPNPERTKYLNEFNELRRKNKI